MMIGFWYTLTVIDATSTPRTGEKYINSVIFKCIRCCTP